MINETEVIISCRPDHIGHVEFNFILGTIEATGGLEAGGQHHLS